MAAIQTSQTQFASNEQITSAKLNNILLQSSFDTGAVTGDGTLTLVSGQMQVGTLKTANFPTGGIIEAKIADGAVTATKLASSVIFVPSGAVMAFAYDDGSTAPSGWLRCNGQAVSRTGTTANLFAVIGAYYGAGDGSTTFNVPDMRGYFLRGSGTNSDGTASGTFGAKQSDQFQGHYHSAPSATGTTGNPYTIPQLGAGTGPAVTTYARTIVTDGSNGTPRIGSETRPSNIAMLYCIKI